MARIWIIALMLIVHLTAASGQKRTVRLQPMFEVASVKPVKGLRGRIYDFHSSGPRVTYTAYSTVNHINGSV